MKGENYLFLWLVRLKKIKTFAAPGAFQSKIKDFSVEKGSRFYVMCATNL